ncbi:MAG: thioredoxin family protein [Bacteroidales bacterium]
MRITKRYEMKVILHVHVFLMILAATACGHNSNPDVKTNINQVPYKSIPIIEKKYKVTFIELGSVRCIPCKQMQSVMKSIEAKYGKEVKIEFYDVWTESGKPYGVKYGIESIPTQVFLDETGKEYYRHVGFFPEEELIKILQMKGIKMN